MCKSEVDIKIHRENSVRCPPSWISKTVRNAPTSRPETTGCRDRCRRGPKGLRLRARCVWDSGGPRSVAARVCPPFRRRLGPRIFGTPLCARFRLDTLSSARRRRRLVKEISVHLYACPPKSRFRATPLGILLLKITL